MAKPRDSEKPEYCDACGHETTEVQWYGGGDGGWLCFVCANTPVGTAELHPNVHPRVNYDVLVTIARTTNMILDAIKEQKSG